MSRLASWAVLLVSVTAVAACIELRERGAGLPAPWWVVLLLWWASFPAAAGVAALLDHRLPRSARTIDGGSPGRSPTDPAALPRGQR